MLGELRFKPCEVCWPMGFRSGLIVESCKIGLIDLEIALFKPIFRSPMSRVLLSLFAGLAIGTTSSSAMAASFKDRVRKDPSEPRAAPLKGDVAAGRQLFAARCSVCHGADAIGGVMAPNLTKVVGSKAAGATFARYSAALKASGLTWTPANLDSFLTAPGKLVPGTSMMMAVSNPADRTNLIAYLASLNAASVPKDRR